MPAPAAYRERPARPARATRREPAAAGIRRHQRRRVGGAASTGSGGVTGDGRQRDGTGGTGAADRQRPAARRAAAARAATPATGTAAAARRRAGTGGTGGHAPPRGPTPAANGTNFPFPQNRQISGCVYPTAYDNNDVMAAYTQVEGRPVDLRTARAGSSACSGRDVRSRAEQHDAAQLDGVRGDRLRDADRRLHGRPTTLFDDLWKYEQLHLDGNGLMNWSIERPTASDGSRGRGAATDADEDMAFALVMADKQWG